VPGAPGYTGVEVSTPARDPYNYPDNAPSVYADSAIMIDARSGEILYYKNPDKRGPVASTQKLLTALLIVEQGGLDRPLTIQRSDTYAEPMTPRRLWHVMPPAAAELSPPG
jgi:D-alanyl-D-alanine carboxypeptidase (penicillin-binding protein 5/6)